MRMMLSMMRLQVETVNGKRAFYDTSKCQTSLLAKTLAPPSPHSKWSTTTFSPSFVVRVRFDPVRSKVRDSKTCSSWKPVAIMERASPWTFWLSGVPLTMKESCLAYETNLMLH